MMHHRFVFVMVITSLALSLTFQLGQTAATVIQSNTDTSIAENFLPAATDIGEGWTLVRGLKPEIDPAVIADATGAVHTGPNGARAAIIVYVANPGRAALQRSWELVGEEFENLRYWQIDADYDREQQLVGIESPSGCVDVRRTDGVDSFFGLPAGATLCAIDPDVNVLTIAFGNVGDVRGYQASDALAVLVFAAGEPV